MRELVLVDVDRFKAVNDGHAAGDQVLQTIADILRAATSGRGHTLEVSASVGITAVEPDAPLDSALPSAEAGMYDRKRAGR